MSELETRRFAKENKDIIESLKMVENRIAIIDKRLGEYDREDSTNYIDILCDEGAVNNLYNEKRKYEKLLSALSNDTERDLASELFAGNNL